MERVSAHIGCVVYEPEKLEWSHAREHHVPTLYVSVKHRDDNKVESLLFSSGTGKRPVFLGATQEIAEAVVPRDERNITTTD